MREKKGGFLVGTSEYINQIISDYLKPIFSFTLKRTRTIQEAEDVTQEIMMKIYNSLLL